VASLFLIFNSAIVFASAAEQFGETYEETEVITGDMYILISEAFTDESLQTPILLEKANKLLANSRTLKKTALELNLKDSESEAAQMESYMVRVVEILEKGGREKHLLTMLLARFYLHYNNCLMNYPGYLKIMVKDHVDEVKSALEEGRMQEVAHLSEHLHLHCDQMYYAAMIFGKKIWQKFSTQIKDISDQIFASAMDGDIEGVKKGIKDIEKPVMMIQDLIK